MEGTRRQYYLMVVCQKTLRDKDASIRNLLRGVILTKFQLFDHVLIDLNPPQVCVCVCLGVGGGVCICYRGQILTQPMYMLGIVKSSHNLKTCVIMLLF